MTSRYTPPVPSRRMWRLTLRNYQVWRKLMLPSLSMNIGEPLVTLLGFGLGLGALVGTINGVDYLQYIATGMIAYSVMFSASFESLYSAFTRMHVQRTWQGIMNAPMLLDDILLGEWLWAAIKGIIAGVIMLIVITLFGLVSFSGLLFALPMVVLAGLTFSGMGLAVNAVARSYDFFSYYFTLFITPMLMLSGAFFPVDIMPPALQTVAFFLPLTHAVELVRPLAESRLPPQMLLNIAVLAAYAAGGLYVSVLLTRRRLLK